MSTTKHNTLENIITCFMELFTWEMDQRSVVFVSVVVLRLLNSVCKLVDLSFEVVNSSVKNGGWEGKVAVVLSYGLVIIRTLVWTVFS